MSAAMPSYFFPKNLPLNAIAKNANKNPKGVRIDPSLVANKSLTSNSWINNFSRASKANREMPLTALKFQTRGENKTAALLGKPRPATKEGSKTKRTQRKNKKTRKHK
jgi:hypothetical protein